MMRAAWQPRQRARAAMKRRRESVGRRRDRARSCEALALWRGGGRGASAERQTFCVSVSHNSVAPRAPAIGSVDSVTTFARENGCLWLRHARERRRLPRERSAEVTAAAAAAASMASSDATSDAAATIAAANAV
eukprot:3196304-Pleurochrysis_carterae.AAC.1